MAFSLNSLFYAYQIIPKECNVCPQSNLIRI